MNSMEQTYFDQVYSSLRLEGSTGWSCSAAVEFFNELTSSILQSYPVLNKGCALELGCGSGEGTFHLEKIGFKATGVDFSDNAICWAKEKALKVGSTAHFKVDDARLLHSFSQDTFDLIVDASCFHCIIDCGDRNKFLGNVWRILKPGGLVVFRSVCGELTDQVKKTYYNPETKVLKRLQTKQNSSADFLHYYQGDSEDIINEITSAGFTLLKHEVLLREADGDCDMLIVHATK